MGLKKFNAKKEIKKLKRRSNKLKKVGVIGAIIGTIFIVSSYSLYSYTKSSVAFNSTINKRVKTTVNVTNGSGGGTREGDYKEEQAFKVYENEDTIYNNETVECSNGATGIYDEKTKTLTVNNQTQDTTCTIKFNKAIKIFDKKYPLIEEQPDFSKGFPNSGTSKIDAKRLSGAYQAEDDYGKMSYYFRGQIENNYVKFAGLTWRIVRINGDGTIRLILNDNSETSKYNTNACGNKKYVGFTYDNNSQQCTIDNPCEVTYNNGTFSNNKFGGTNSTIKTYLENWYKQNLNNYDSKISYNYYCDDTSYGSGNENSTSESDSLKYGSWQRTQASPYQPSLKCLNPINNVGQIRTYGGLYKLKIGLLTGDEINMAGFGVYNTPNATSNNYLYHEYEWWSISSGFSHYCSAAMRVNQNYLGNLSVDANYIVLPVINLNANVTASQGDGSKTSPFVVN